jgi:hypothetical protein
MSTLSVIIIAKNGHCHNLITLKVLSYARGARLIVAKEWRRFSPTPHKGVLSSVPMLCGGLFTVPVLCGYKCLGGVFKILILKYSPDFLFFIPLTAWALN